MKALLSIVTVTAALALPGAASAEVLFNHTPSVVGFHPTVQDFEGINDEDDTQVADDFRVPAGEVWIVQRVFVDGRKPGDAGPGVPEFVRALLFGSQGTLPAAAPFYSEELTPASGTAYPDFDLALPGVPLLPAGTWWFGAQPRMDFNPNNDYWFWGTVPTKVGNGAAYRNPGDGFGGGCTTFTLMVGCVTNVGNPDVSFRVEGIRLNGDLEVTKSKALAGGRLRVTVNAPNEGTLTIKSNLMKPVTRDVAEPGTQLRVLLKPKGKAKRKLAGGLRPKAKLTLDGLDPYFNGDEVDPGRFKRKLKP